MTAEDWDRIVGYLPELARGAGITFGAAIAAILFASALGILVAGAGRSDKSWVRSLNSLYVETVRATPELVQVYIWFFFLPVTGLVLPPIAAGIVALTVAFGPYLGEVFRAGIAAVEPTQWEAGKVLGMNRFTLWRRVILPQAFRTVLPVWTGYVVTMYKATSLLSFITVRELFGTARFAAALNFRYFELFALVMVGYLLLGIPTVILLHRLERRLNPTQYAEVKASQDLSAKGVI